MRRPPNLFARARSRRGLLALGLLLAGWPAAGATNQSTTVTNALPSRTVAPATNPAPAVESSSATTTNEPTIITSERLNVDYLQNLGTFTGNVLVVDPRITVRADKMVVYYGTTNQVQGTTNVTERTVTKVEASGGVIITTGDKKSESEHAVYTAADGKVVLTENPHVEGPDGNVTGQRITFWRDSKKMDVESSSRLILYPQDQKNKDAAPDDKPPQAASPPATGAH